MKNYKSILAIALTAITIKSNAQGWIGNGSNLYPLNTSATLTPLNIGIGTNSPSEQLHTTAGVRFQGITASTTANQVLVQDATGKLFSRTIASLGNFWSLTGNAGTVPGVGTGQNYLGTSDGQRLVFATGGASGAAERMTILNTSGNVGIGTTAPTNQFQVYSTGGDNQVAVGGSSPSIKFHQSLVAPIDALSTLGTPFSKIGLATNSGDFVTTSIPGDMIIQTIDTTNSIIFSNKFVPGASGLEQMRLNKKGYLGIGTTTPTHIIEVHIGSSTGYFDQVTGWSGTSDARLKTDINKIENPLEMVNKLNGVYYKWKSNPEKGRLIGFLAQDVQKVLPEAVSGKEGDISKGEVLGMAYQNIVPLLVEAVKEQTQIVNSQQQQINELKALINSLTASNNTQTNIQSTNLNDKEAVVLNQNTPNPFAEQTTISYTIPENSTTAQLLFYDMSGRQIKQVDITTKGSGQLNVYANDLTNGMYSYTLMVDGNIVGTKKMVKQQ